MTTYVYPVWQTDFLFLIYANNVWNYTYMCIYIPYLCSPSVKWPSKNIFILQLYLFFHMYDHLRITCLKDWLPGITFCMYARVHVSTCMCMYIYRQTFASHIFLSYLWFFIYSLFDNRIRFCKCLWIFTAINKYFTVSSHIFSFTSMTTYVVLIWQTCEYFLIYANNF